MNKCTNELEQFIYHICYQKLLAALNEYIASHIATINWGFCSVKYPEIAYVEDMLLEFTRNISIDEDTLSFEAVLSCTVYVEDDDGRSAELSKWFLVSCDALIEDKLKQFKIRSVSNYTAGCFGPSGKIAVSKNIVPILYKKDLDAEAEVFLKKYYPIALEVPTPIPIAEVAESMGLNIVQGYCITNDFSVFGEICFSEGQVETYDIFKCIKSNIDVKRGTIIIDANTFWERNIGCVNNTIAHEVYHWYKHRLYAAVKQILSKEKLIACRCPSSNIYPKKDEIWTDEQRMEWQANNMAPRILMPVKTFKVKVEELYKKYDYTNSASKTTVLNSVANELAQFYDVSRQSVMIRMIEVGYEEVAEIYQSNQGIQHHTYINEEDAFCEYSNNLEFRGLIDNGLFIYVDGFFVINDSMYIYRDDANFYSLTEYAFAHLEECTLKFYWQKISRNSAKSHLPHDIFHRDNEDQKVSKFHNGVNDEVIKYSEELRRKREEFERQKETYKLITPSFTCWEMMYRIIQSRGISKAHFCSVTGLGEEVYRKAEKNVSTKPNIRTIVSFAHGLNLGLSDTEKLMQLAGHAFDESDEHQALKFCVTGFSGKCLEDCNAFLESYGYLPLGTKQRL